MERRDFIIESNNPVADRTYRLELSAVGKGWKFEGEFVDVAIDGYYLRRPLSVCDCSQTGLVLYYKTVGEGTKALSHKKKGETLDLLTGLGRGFDASLCREGALLAGGGLGSAPLFLLAKELKSQGKKVYAALGFNKASEIVLEKEFRELCDGFAIATLDGSQGIRGCVTDAIDGMKPEYDFFYTCGPLPMMKAVCKRLQTPGQASLEERMGCGAGFCYGCSCKTLTGNKRICKDGPVFDKEEIIW